MSARFSIRGESRGTEHRLVLAGDLDLAATYDLEPALARALEAGTRRVVIDMREVGFMDSMGLRSILAAKELCAEHGAELAVIPNPEVLRIFEVTGLVDEVPWHDPSE